MRSPAGRRPSTIRRRTSAATESLMLSRARVVAVEAVGMTVYSMQLSAKKQAAGPGVREDRKYATKRLHIPTGSGNMQPGGCIYEHGPDRKNRLSSRPEIAGLA